MAYRDTVIFDAPSEYWEFSETTGTNAVSSAAGAHTATHSGGVLVNQPGIAGTKGVVYDGVDDLTTTTTAVIDFMGGTNFTVEMWVKYDGTYTNDYPTFFRRDGLSHAFLIRTRNTTVGQAHTIETYFNGKTVSTGATTFNDNKWHHVVVQKASTTLRLWVDNVEYTSNSGTLTAGGSGATAAFIGRGAGAGEYFKGSLDDLAIYTSALSTTRIAAHYTSGAPVDSAVDVTTPSLSLDAVVATGIIPVHATMNVATADPINLSTLNLTSVDVNNQANLSASREWAYEVGGANIYHPSSISIASGGGGSSTVNWLADFELPTGMTNSGLDIASLKIKVNNTTGTDILIYPLTSEYSTNQNSGFATGTPLTWTPVANSLNTIDVKSLVNVAGFYGFLFVQAGSTGNYASVDTNTGTTPPKLALTYRIVPETIDVTVPTASISLDAVAASVTVPVDTTVASASLSMDTVGATVTTQTNPDTESTVETPSLNLGSLDVTVSLPTEVTVETPFLTLENTTVLSETTMNAIEDADTPAFTLNAVRVTSVNDEPVLVTESEDPYFNATMSNISTNPASVGYSDMWMRLDEASGTKVHNRAIKNATGYDYEGSVGTYNGVTIGQFNGPEGRRSVHFNGAASIDVYDPYNAINNADEVFYGPSTLEFSFRSERPNEYLMGGWDKQGSTPGSGISSAGAASEFWLKDGKLNFRSYTMPPAYTGRTTPDLVTNVIGFKNLSDGLWHHVVINTGGMNVARGTSYIEFWVDGKLEVRRFGGDTAFGIPDQIGNRGNSYDGFVMPAVGTSQGFVGDMTEVIYRNRRILTEDQIHLQDDTFFSRLPVYAETPSLTIKSVDASAKGNKTRVMLLDFQTGANLTINRTWSGVGPKPGSDVNGRVLEAPPYQTTYNFAGLRQLYDGSIYLPVPEAYQYFTVPVRNNYADAVTDNERVIDLDLDVNMDDFDVIAICNFPQNDTDWAWYTGMDEYNTPPFITGKRQVELLLGQVKAKVKGGKKLFVNDPTSAIMLGIVDRIEWADSMRESVVNDNRLGSVTGLYDARAATNNPFANDTLASADRYRDEHANQIQRVRKTVQGLTTLPSYIVTDYMEWYATDPFSTPPMNNAIHVEDRSNGLQVGDEFYMNGSLGPGILNAFDQITSSRPTQAARVQGWVAAPIDNVKVGSVVTSFSRNVWNKTNLESNPYKDYAVNIVIEPGNTWDGDVVQGKAYVNFTEAFTPWAGYTELSEIQVVPDVTPERLAKETPARRFWQWSTWRGTWTGQTVNPNEASGAGSIATSGTSGGITGQKINNDSASATGVAKPTRKPNITTLVTFSWRSDYPTESIVTLSMANRGLRWLTEETTANGNVIADVETPTLTLSANNATGATVQSAETTVATGRLVIDSNTLTGVTEPSVSVIVSTPTVTLTATAFIEAVQVATPSLVISGIPVETNLLDGADMIEMVLPVHSLTLYLEDK